MRNALRPALVALAALSLLGVTACSDDEGPAASDAPADGGGTGDGSMTVSVDDNVFEPEQTTVAVGDTVAWDWVGSEPHNVSGDDFASDVQTEGTFEHTFDDAGTYDYVCQVHPGMAGTVEVEA